MNLSEQFDSSSRLCVLNDRDLDPYVYMRSLTVFSFLFLFLQMCDECLFIVCLCELEHVFT